MTSPSMKCWRFKDLVLIWALLWGAFFLTACGADNTGDETGSGGEPTTLALSMDLPDSVTGGPQTITEYGSQAGLRAARSGTGTACAFMGAEEEDPFRNGYAMTQFLVSAVATWTCFADTLIEVAADVPHDGTIHATDNQVGQPDYDPDDPTHYAVTDDGDTQTTMKFYYGYDRDTPPQAEADPQFYLSWITAADGGLTGRLIIDALGLDPEDRDPEDPVMLRMDFGYDEALEEIDMFLRFDANNPWAEGFRIQLTKDLTAGPLEQVFTALGLMEMQAQFLPAAGIGEVPEVHIFTVSDSFGNGAALADFRQLSLPLELNAATFNHLGNYLFDKTDIYFFDEDMDWDWIAKSIPAATYRGSRTTPESGGRWIPFDPSLEMITTELDLDADYFFGDKCAQVDDDCTALLNAVFADGFADQEPNQGADPEDWRSAAIADPGSLESIYPNGADWSGAFDMELTSTLTAAP